ncbi:glycosyl transferase [Actinokineospora sp. NBRC 105648]|uniref:glycosyl transferase n=1 Tax=Actinokineospora sp. NBRC 105648 TaxID=3032206 RepID=UPI0024A5AA07|nr:glycosyl transferase [Actinokineospora sp. NBRC 105648]GLZ42150.1 glycosyl transferase [Actinokineospora sp. NBRC 105648]
MTSHRWSADSSDRLTARSWRTAAEARTRALDRDILAVAALAALAGGSAVLRLGAADAPAQAGEGRNVAQAFAVDTLGGLVDSVASPLAWLQVGAYTAATEAYERHTAVLAAVREPMVLAAAGTAVLLWVLARRMGLSRTTAAAAVAITAVSPMALGLQLGVRPENVAMPWALGALALLWTPRRHRRLAPDLWAVTCLVIAVITAPLTMVLAVTAAWLVWRRRRKRLSLMLACLFTLGVGIGLGAASALSGIRLAAEGPPSAHWLEVDPFLCAVGLVAAIAALGSFRLRPLAAGVLALTAVAAIPNGPGTGALVLAVAPAALAVVGTVERALGHRARAGRHTWARPLRLPVAVAALVIAIVAVPTWYAGARAAVAARTDPAPLAQARLWLLANLPTEPLVTDGISWVELIRAGRSVAATTRPADCADTCSAQSWLLVTPAMRPVLERRPALAAAAAAAETVAVFGSGADLVEIHRPAAAGAGTVAMDEQRARSRAGERIADSARIAAGGEVLDTLRAGRTDPRLLATLSALGSTRPVRVVALPAVPGEDAAGQPRRQALLAAAGEQAEQLVLFFTGQRGVFRPESVTSTSDGVLVRYPAGSPAGLLTPFDTP